MSSEATDSKRSTNTERLLISLQLQGEALVKHSEWFQKVIDRQQTTIWNCQETINHFQADLAANKLAIDSLRAEYRKLLADGNS